MKAVIEYLRARLTMAQEQLKLREKWLREAQDEVEQAEMLLAEAENFAQAMERTAPAHFKGNDHG